MRRLVPALAFVLLAATIPLVLAEDKPGLLPWNPLEKLAAGDWLTYRVKTSHPNSPPETCSVVWRVTEANGKLVVEESVVEAGAKAVVVGNRTFEDRKTPTIVAFLGRPHDTVVEQKLEDETKTVGGREWKCQRLEVQLVSKSDDKTVALIWISREVTGGVLAMRTRTTKPAETVELELAGYGPKDGKTWGKGPAELK